MTTTKGRRSMPVSPRAKIHSRSSSSPRSQNGTSRSPSFATTPAEGPQEDVLGDLHRRNRSTPDRPATRLEQPALVETTREHTVADVRGDNADPRPHRDARRSEDGTMLERTQTDDSAEPRDLVCSICGYGIARPRPPRRCPMCQTSDAWAHSHRQSLGQLRGPASRSHAPDDLRAPRTPHIHVHPEPKE
jgi:hypothetical protein